MSLIDLIRRPAKTSADLKAKLETLRTIDPLASVPQLRAEREKALMACKDDEVSRLDAEILGAQRDDERKTLAEASLAKEIAEAEQTEHAAEVNRLRKAAESSKKRMPGPLAKFEKAVALIEEALREIDEIEEPVEKYNAIAPEGEKLDTAEFSYRGGLHAEPRTERSRKVVDEFWSTVDGQRLSKSTVESEHFQEVDENNAWLWIIDSHPSTNSLMAELPDITQSHPSAQDRGDFSRRRVAVVKMRAIDVLHDEYRSGWAPTPLRHEVGVLPTVLPTSDPRKPRGTITTRIVERIESAADVETISEAAE